MGKEDLLWIPNGHFQSILNFLVFTYSEYKKCIDSIIIYWRPTTAEPGAAVIIRMIIIEQLTFCEAWGSAGEVQAALGDNILRSNLGRDVLLRPGGQGGFDPHGLRRQTATSLLRGLGWVFKFLWAAGLHVCE